MRTETVTARPSGMVTPGNAILPAIVHKPQPIEIEAEVEQE